MTQAQRFLVKMRPPTGLTSLKLDGETVDVHVEPLFKSISTSTLGAAAAPTWHIVEPQFAIDGANPWDVCHAIVQQGLGLAGGQAEFAEPDLEQKWISASPDEILAAAGQACDPVPQDTGENGFPGDPDNAWYRNDEHAQFNDIDPVGLPDEVVRVAHLDTGYDPDHASLPTGLELTLQRNFVDDDRPNDASDDSSGIFTNRGHGTGTLSILAGKPVPGVGIPGGAPFAKVVPIRVANRVELFYNSAVAQAFDYVHGLCASPGTAVDVVTMSMGGLASRAWADAVNALYDAGVVVVTAAGNNFGNLPTRNIVFPARFNRVVAACGVMANQQPYANLGRTKMAGNYGPPSKMNTAMAAFTPNVPWAKFGCPRTVRFDGSGTSAATPQIAAAAATWIRKNRADLKQLAPAWRRAEAVRQALFKSAGPGSVEMLGRGTLRANDLLGLSVSALGTLEQARPDSAAFEFLRILTGLGVDAGSPVQREMLELEALQLSQSEQIEKLLPDPKVDPQSLSFAQRQAIAHALATHPRASAALRNALAAAPVGIGAPPPVGAPVPSTIDQMHLRHALSPEFPPPAGRRLRIYAYDPSLGTELDTVALNETVSTVRWEPTLAPGPVGEYLEVVDVDPSSDCCYAPVDLNDPRLLAADGLRPAEGNPQFHQQMVYAVAMSTIDYFERALGRVALWAPRFEPLQRPDSRRHGVDERFVQRLRIYPHALRARNAYYSPDKKALLLGYFVGNAAPETSASEIVFTALSHDIVAHETTHALLDGLHRRFREPTNPDVLAFHEGFADIVALFQHFSLEGSLHDEIARSRGDLTQETMLSKLAIQFGRAAEDRRSLRDFIGEEVTDEVTKKKTWRRKEPTRNDYANATEPHDRGAVLVAAVFDAFLQIYSRRALVPIRLATNGSEVLRPGALSNELANALTQVAAKTARTVLLMCIRALDYCPPVDITFGDFLRAIVTADKDLVPDDPLGHRVAFASAFRARGIYPENVRTVSVDTLTWEPPPMTFKNLRDLFSRIEVRWDLQTHRREAWRSSRENAEKFHRWLLDKTSDEELASLGLSRTPNPKFVLEGMSGPGIEVDMHGIEVHSVRPVRRVGPDGNMLSQLVVELTQSLHAKDGSDMVYRGGATLIIDLNRRAVTYLVRKRFDQKARVTRQQGMRAAYGADIGNIYQGANGAAAEPFALLHGFHQRGTE